jgi:metal-responsive CopG/Arc/MetJ family transcriptional regulator
MLCSTVMTFSIHLENALAERLDRTVRDSGKPRNALIREAVREWLDRHQPRQWPAEIMSFRGVKGLARFEHGRKRLRPPRDPFDAISA